jgi:hypothetical protein
MEQPPKVTKKELPAIVTIWLVAQLDVFTIIGVIEAGSFDRNFSFNTRQLQEKCTRIAVG